MSRYLSLDEFRQRFEVVPPDSLSALEPTKYYDPFVEREEV